MTYSDAIKIVVNVVNGALLNSSDRDAAVQAVQALGQLVQDKNQALLDEAEARKKLAEKAPAGKPAGKGKPKLVKKKGKK